VTVVAAAVVVDGCEIMKAFACMRVRIVSTGWIASVDIPPEIQPAVKSIQDDSLDMLVLRRDRYYYYRPHRSSHVQS